jgi:hypothetical protein
MENPIPEVTKEFPYYFNAKYKAFYKCQKRLREKFSELEELYIKKKNSKKDLDVLNKYIIVKFGCDICYRKFLQLDSDKRKMTKNDVSGFKELIEHVFPTKNE